MGALKRDADRPILLLVAVIFAVAAIAFWRLLDVVVLSLSLGVVAMPLHRRLSIRVRPWVSSFLITVVVFVLVFGALIGVAAVLLKNSGYVIEVVSTILGWIAAPGTDGAIAGLPVSTSQALSWTQSLVGNMDGYLAGTLTALPMLAVKVLVFFLSLYVILLRGEQVKREVISRLPDALRSAVDRISPVAVDTVYAIYVVHVATSVITFVLAVPFFWFLGYDHVIFFAVIAAILQLIPILGPTILMATLAAYALAIGDMRGLALIALIGYPIVCAMPDLYLRPIMMGKHASIHPVIMWIGFFGGLATMGIVGFILGPLFLALAVASYHILIDELRQIGPLS